LQQPLDHCFVSERKSAGHASRLPQRADINQVRRTHLRVREYAAPIAHDAKAMRIVDHQPCVMALGQGEQLRDRREVAIHAEYAVADDQLGAGRTGAQLLLEREQVEVRIDLHGGARQARTVDQRGMVERIGENRRVFAGERRQHGQVRHIAGRKIECARCVAEAAGVGGQILFGLRMGARVAAQQVRAAAAGAIARGAFGQRLGQRRVSGQTEIIVACEADQRAAVDLHMRIARRVGDAAPAGQPGRVDSAQLVFK
jgi:hypothetical protein